LSFSDYFVGVQWRKRQFFSFPTEVWRECNGGRAKSGAVKWDLKWDLPSGQPWNLDSRLPIASLSPSLFELMADEPLR